MSRFLRDKLAPTGRSGRSRRRSWSMRRTTCCIWTPSHRSSTGACRNSGVNTGSERIAWSSRSTGCMNRIQRWPGSGCAALASSHRSRAPAPKPSLCGVRNWRARDLPRAWILSDAAVFSIAHANPANAAALEAVQPMNERFAATLLRALALASEDGLQDLAPVQDSRPTPEQKALLDALSKTVDARAAELEVSAEVLAPRGELKALAMGKRDTHALTGWRLQEIGTRLLATLGETVAPQRATVTP